MLSGTDRLLLAAAMALLPALAQAADFEPGRRGICPPAGTVGHSDTVFPDRDALSGSNQFTVSVPEVELSRDSSLFDTINGPPLGFGDRIELLERSENDTRVGLFRQRATRTGDRCGWMEIENARNLGDLRPRLVVELPGREAETAIDGETRSRLDAQIVARASRDGEGRLVAVPLFSAPDSRPGDDGGMRFALETPISFFSIASVLDFQGDRNPQAGGGCNDVRDETCFLLLGGVNASGREDLLGWVRGSDVELWPSTLSLYFAQGRAGVPYFFDYCAALAEIPNQDPGLCLAEPAGTGAYSAVRGNNVPRFPIISVDRIEDGAGTHFIYELVTALNICVEGSQRGECRDATAFLQEQGEDQIRIDQLRNVDILFVIDGTDTMTDFFGPIVEAAIEFAAEVVSDNQLAPRFSAVTYGDYLNNEGRPENVSFLPIADFGAVGDASNLLALRNIGAIQAQIQDPHRAWLEAPFAALVRALDPLSAGWRPDSALRLVIWISDIGNRGPGFHETALGGVTEHVTAQTVAEAFARASAAGPTAVRLAGINVPASPRLEQSIIDMHRESFEHDYDLLRSALPTRSYALQQVRESDPDQVRLAVYEALDSILTSVVTVERCIEGEIDCDLIAGDVAADGDSSDGSLVSMQIGSELARELGLLSETREGLRDGEIVAVESIFVVQSATEPQFDYWLALRRRELEHLVNTMSTTCSDMDLRQFGPALAESYVNVLETATRREVDRNISPAEFIATVLSVPKETFSDMLDVPFNQLYQTLQADDDAANTFHRDVCTRTEMLRAVLRGNRLQIDDLLWENNRARLRPGAEVEQFRWDWSGQGGGNQYYFFPLSMLP